ncbi:hypothetical protein K432DRAFT_272815, partial [Lepidopterella palustris CBS 459.81]
ENLGLPSNTGTSEVVFAGPFPLFSGDATRRLRKELLSEEVQNNCEVKPRFVGRLFRGMVPSRYAQYANNLWWHRDTLSRISMFAEIDLEPVMDMEISNVNMFEPGEGEHGVVVKWHKDSYPYVCVVMLSTTMGIKGGETVLRGPYGECRELEPIQMGCAYILQGQHIDHMVKSFTGSNKRITAITYLRPCSPFLIDETYLGMSRQISPSHRLYGEFFKYRMGQICARVRNITNEKTPKKKLVGTEI